jgi:hypothetical protein
MKNSIEQDEFENFLFYIDDYLEEFINETNSLGYSLNFSIESLENLEEYIIVQNITNEVYDDEKRFKCWVYLGELFRKLSKKAYWMISNSSDNSANLGLYVLTGYDEIGVEFVPIRYIRAFIIKKKKGFFKDLINSHIAPIPLDLNKFPNEEDPKQDKPRGGWSVFD